MAKKGLQNHDFLLFILAAVKMILAIVKQGMQNHDSLSI